LSCSSKIRLSPTGCLFAVSFLTQWQASPHWVGLVMTKLPAPEGCIDCARSRSAVPLSDSIALGLFLLQDDVGLGVSTFGGLRGQRPRVIPIIFLACPFLFRAVRLSLEPDRLPGGALHNPTFGFVYGMRCAGIPKGGTLFLRLCYLQCGAP